jgi:hypothetical protein
MVLLGLGSVFAVLKSDLAPGVPAVLDSAAMCYSGSIFLTSPDAFSRLGSLALLLRR